jgi:O-antigen ligase
MSRSEKIVYWTICLTPLWWLLGIQVLLYPTVVFALFVLNFNLDKLIRSTIPLCIWSWLLMVLVMLWTMGLGLNAVDFDPLKAIAALVMLYKSYLLVFAALLLPFFCSIRIQVITRATAWLASGFLVTLAIELGMLFLKIGGAGFIPPLARLIPGDKQSMRVTFAVFQPFFGIPLPRTVLYTADPPIVAVCAILFFFICLGESNRTLRRVSLTGCLVALLISQSRLAWICFPIMLMIMGCVRRNWVRQWFLWVSALTSLVSSYLGITFKDFLTQPMELFTKARPESSTDREVVVQKTLEAWQEKPWLGWGTVQGSVKWHIYDIALGAFSTYPSVLYLHGIIGLAIFIVAQATTVGAFWNAAVQGNTFCLRAVASLLGLYMLCSGMPFTWMLVYFWFFFIWLGAILVELQQHQTSPQKQQMMQWV